MRKLIVQITTTLAAIAVLSTSAQAEGFFIGAGIGNIDFTVAATSNNQFLLPDQSSTESGSTTNITFGAYLSDELMVSATYGTVATEEITGLTQTTSVISGSANYLIDMGSALVPFVGASASNFSYESSGWKAIGYDNDIISISSLFITIDLGIHYEIADKLMFVADYKVPVMTSNTAGTNALAVINFTIELEYTPTGSWSAGILYNF